MRNTLGMSDNSLAVVGRQSTSVSTRLGLLKFYISWTYTESLSSPKGVEHRCGVSLMQLFVFAKQQTEQKLQRTHLNICHKVSSKMHRKTFSLGH